MAEYQHKLTLCDNPHFEALGALYEGGSKFVIPPPEPQRSWCLVDRNKRTVEYFWQRGSSSLPLLLAACERHGFKTDAPSWSRLCKHIWEAEIMPKPSEIKCHPYAVQLATDKRHWHKTKVTPGIYPNITEIDIKSAYAQSVANMPSLLMNSHYRAAEDGGAIHRWQALFPQLDKRTRLAMIGWLSGYEFPVLEAGVDRNAPLRRYKIRKTYDGGVFNCIHVALFKLYKLLQEVEQIDPSNVPRIHTDSLWIDSRIKTEKLETMLNRIKGERYSLSVKGHGQSNLYDLNSGVIGGRLIGIPEKVLPRFEFDRAQFPWLFKTPCELDSRFLDIPYRNERYSIAQIHAIMKRSGKTLVC